MGKREVIDEASGLSKMSKLLESKNTVSREDYLTALPIFKANLIFRSRCRMLNLKNNFKNGERDLQCELCKAEIDNDEHIFNNCPKLETFRNKYRVCRDEVFRPETTCERMAEIAEFLAEVKKMRRL